MSEPTKNQCLKCEYLTELYERTPKNERDYWLMTEIFVMLHGTDVCQGKEGKSGFTDAEMREVVQKLCQKIKDLKQSPTPKVVTREWLDKWVLQFKGIYVGEDDYWNKRKLLIQMLADLGIVVEENKP